MKRIFIMSSERSGSNLLRKILGSHSSLIAPPPFHGFRIFNNLINLYPDISKRDVFEKLLNDVLKIANVERSHLNWNYKPGVERLLSKVNLFDIPNAVLSIYDCMAEDNSKAGWVCKENNIFDYAYQILSSYPDSRFIYLVRDGRDVACSIKNVPSHDKVISYIANEWKREQISAINVLQNLRSSNRCAVLKYEDLLQRPEDNIGSICVFVGIPFEKEMLGYYNQESSKDESNKTAYWKNLAKPVMSDNFNKYKKLLTVKEIKTFEAIAGKILMELGYSLDFELVNSYKPSLIKRIGNKILNEYYLGRQKKLLMKESGRVERSNTIRAIRNSLGG